MNEFSSNIRLRYPLIRATVKLWLKPGELTSTTRPPSMRRKTRKPLAAIDEGIRDADAGRTVPIEQVRRLLPKWITASSSRRRKDRNE